MYAAAPAPMPDIAALTDGEGAFGLEAAGTGSYELAVVADGYARAQVPVEVSDLGDAEVHVVLEATDR
jgi:hypothetical protein